MPDFGIMRGFGSKLFSDKLVAGQLPTQLGLIGSLNINPLLLDLYPNAAAAYSLRQLRTLYTGSAIRVRRSSDNAEQNIGFTGLGGLDTSALTSFCGSGNGFVTTWYDQSGNSRNAVQTTAVIQPQIVSSGSVILMNSKPTLFFDGSTNSLSLITSIPSQNTYSVFALGFVNTTASGPDMFICGNQGSAGFRFDGGTPNGKITLTKTNISDIASANIPSGNQTLGSYLSNNNNTKLYTNSVLRVTGGVINPTAVINTIGATATGQHYLGNMQEIVLYTSDESINRTGIETNINTDYGIY